MLANTILLIASELAFDQTSLHGFDFTLILWETCMECCFQLTETGSTGIQSTVRINVSFSYM